MMKHRPPAGAMPGRDLSAVMERMRPALMAFFVRRLSDPVQAEDLIQDLFIRMATMRGPATDNPEGYIFQAAEIGRAHV